MTPAQQMAQRAADDRKEAGRRVLDAFDRIVDAASGFGSDPPRVDDVCQPDDVALVRAALVAATR